MAMDQEEAAKEIERLSGMVQDLEDEITRLDVEAYNAGIEANFEF